MARAYRPKKIEVIWEQVETKPEEIEQRISEAYAILLEETLKFLKGGELIYGKEVEETRG